LSRISFLLERVRLARAPDTRTWEVPSLLVPSFRVSVLPHSQEFTILRITKSLILLWEGWSQLVTKPCLIWWDQNQLTGYLVNRRIYFVIRHRYLLRQNINWKKAFWA
jgi:hypothetical protein